jgi:tetratricopeptide (TPR) repeat protein
VQALTDCIALNPKYSTAYQNRGVAYQHLGLFEKALEDYATAIELNPTSSSLWSNRAFANNCAGRYKRGKIHSIGDSIDSVCNFR